MSHRRKSVVLTILLVGALGGIAVGAQDNTANATRQVVKANLRFHSATHLAGTALNPGTYTVSADGSKVTLSQHGKTVAEAPIQWKDEQAKARHSSVVSDSGQVEEIHFAGNKQYIVIMH
jgi:hypothetical protein